MVLLLVRDRAARYAEVVEVVHRRRRYDERVQRIEVVEAFRRPPPHVREHKPHREKEGLVPSVTVEEVDAALRVAIVRHLVVGLVHGQPVECAVATWLRAVEVVEWRPTRERRQVELADVVDLADARCAVAGGAEHVVYQWLVPVDAGEGLREEEHTSVLRREAGERRGARG